MPTISILLAVHNGAAFLDAAIDSVHQQSFSDWELIAVNNGSTDATASILKSWQQRDSRIRAVTLNTKGKNLAFNHAFSLSKAPFICFFAADDLLHPDSIGRRLAPLLANPALTYSTCLLETISEEPRFHGLVFPRHRPSPNFSGGSILFTRTLATEIFPVPLSLPNEDVWAALHLKAFGRGVHIPETMYFYRIHSVNSYGYHAGFEAKRKGFLERMRAHVLFLDKQGHRLSTDRVHYLNQFGAARDAAERGDRWGIILGSLPVRDKLLFVYYCSPILFLIRQRLFRFLSGQFELV